MLYFLPIKAYTIPEEVLKYDLSFRRRGKMGRC